MFTSLLPALLVVVGAGVFLVYLYCCLLALLGVECVVVAVSWWQGPSPRLATAHLLHSRIREGGALLPHALPPVVPHALLVSAWNGVYQTEPSWIPLNLPPRLGHLSAGDL